MAQPAEHRAPTTREGNVHPKGTAVLVGPRYVVPLWPSDVAPKFAGGGMGGAQGTGAGGGAGKSDGGGDDDDDGQSDADKQLGGRLKKLETKLTKQFNATIKSELTAALTPLTETFSKFSEKLDQLGQGGTGGQGGQGGKSEGKSDGGVDIENHPLFKGALKKIDDLTKKADLAEQRRSDTEAASRKAERDRKKRETVQGLLAAAGIEGIRAEEALGSLVDSRKLIDYEDDESEDLIFRGKTKDDVVDLDSGFGDWLKTDHAKLYLPPRGASGSGDRGGGRAPGKGAKGQLQAGELGRAILKAANQLPQEPE